jgi:hypothetical protein
MKLATRARLLEGIKTKKRKSSIVRPIRRISFDLNENFKSPKPLKNRTMILKKMN